MARYARMKIALLAALRGNIILFEGEELGLEQDDIPFELLQDPEAIANYPLTLSRDGVRTPMPWRDEPLGGFTTGTPWLPLSPANCARAVAVQEANPASQLALTRQVLALRKTTPALRTGTFGNCHKDGTLLRFERRSGSQTITCLFNLGPDAIAGPAIDGSVLLAVNAATGRDLPGYCALYIVG
jgi:alpha-glucosidase